MDEKKRSRSGWTVLLAVVLALPTTYVGVYVAVANCMSFGTLVYEIPGFPMLLDSTAGCYTFMDPDALAQEQRVSRRQYAVQAFFWPAHQLDRRFVRPEKWHRPF